MMILTDADRDSLDAIEYLLRHRSDDRTFTCKELGERLYRDEPSWRKPQCYLRPVGRALKRLAVMGYVVATWREEGRLKKRCYTRTSKVVPALAAHESRRAASLSWYERELLALRALRSKVEK